MKTLLVTGGAGFIGSNFIRYILNTYPDYRIINFDKLTYSGNLNNLKDISQSKSYTFVKGDICNKKVILEAMRDVDYVINFAAESHVDRSIKDSSVFIKTNVNGVQVLLDAAKKFKIKKILHISTDEVYGDIENGFSKEDDKLLPNSPYAATKAAADLLCRSYFKTYNMPIIITRSSNNFGPYQYPEKLIPLFITNAIEGEKLPLYGDGTNARDWIYVIDNCSGIASVLKNGKAGGIYNIGGNNLLKNIDIAKDIIDIGKLSRDAVTFVKDRPGHDRRYALNSNRLKEIGWKPVFDFKKAMRLTFDWYKSNSWWWKPIKRKAKIIRW